MKKAPRRLRFLCQVYDAPIHVQFGGARDSAVRWSAKLDGIKPDPDILGGTSANASTIGQKHGFAFLVWFRDYKPNARVMAHECVHVASHILDSRGVSPGKSWSENTEAQAYLVDWIFSKMQGG